MVLLQKQIFNFGDSPDGLGSKTIAKSGCPINRNANPQFGNQINERPSVKGGVFLT